MKQRIPMLQIGSLLLLAGGLTAVSAIAAKQRARTMDQAGRWHTLTVNLPLSKVSPKGALPAPLAELGDMIEVRFRSAPRGQGTEIAARLTDMRDQDETTHGGLEKLRTALRSTRSILETGEVLEPTKPGSSRTTALNWPMNIVTGHSRGEGRL